MEKFVKTFEQFVNESKTYSKSKLKKIQNKIEKHPAFDKYFRLTGDSYEDALEMWIEKYYDMVDIYSAEDAENLITQLINQEAGNIKEAKVNETKMSFDEYKKLIEKEIDPKTFEDQLFYDHMVTCFHDGNSPIDCVNLWEAGDIKESRVDESKIADAIMDLLEKWYKSPGNNNVLRNIMQLTGITDKKHAKAILDMNGDAYSAFNAFMAE